jgi:hypothetical protein
VVAKADDIANLPFWPRLLSPEQACAYLGVGYRLFQASVAPFVSKISGFGEKRVLYDIRDLDALVDSRKSGPRPSAAKDWLDALGDDNNGQSARD